MNEPGIWLPQASSEAAATDTILIALLVVSSAIVLLVAGLITVFAIRYRKGSPASREPLPSIFARDVEFGWTFATLGLFIAIFAWAASQNITLAHPPAARMEIHVLAKRWMWKVEHAGGQGEIDELHVPAGELVELIMQSEDVIHSFYVPAFRVKQDVVPGHTERLRFTPEKPGTYHLFCAEYCGTDHSRMIGRVVVQSPEEFAAWLTRQPQEDDLAKSGRQLFVRFGCAGCHEGQASVRAPRLSGLFGAPVQLADGRTVTADDAYVRDSILQPKRDIVAGYDPVMPSFAGVVSDGEIAGLTAYIRALRAPADGGVY
ncbi:cytochrome c oxidase subunit II [Mangrovicella endophytica]|uniref:cytochrome c oxidase subunit II n=1 Tax=Mangrovicella endophytica TaxID=2066697 RepID=UPI000C9EB216|nr:cytochrome c oxidase subunit II [Mangrovicella endophytica]